MSIAQAVAIEQIAYWRHQGLSREEMRAVMGLGPDDEIGLVRALQEAWMGCRAINRGAAASGPTPAERG
ncbi:hypothetical protein STAQ_27860 [Allostella sp. ATCC 35155]|nr:hypothetical protein STAQ_27860 [Stella sp. ATCC 35155]